MLQSVENCKSVMAVTVARWATCQSGPVRSGEHLHQVPLLAHGFEVIREQVLLAECFDVGHAMHNRQDFHQLPPR